VVGFTPIGPEPITETVFVSYNWRAMARTEIGAEEWESSHFCLPYRWSGQRIADRFLDVENF
jgi:hypothetical protein